MARYFPVSLTANFTVSFDVVIPTCISPVGNSFTVSLRGPATHDFVGTTGTGTSHSVSFTCLMSVAGKYRYSIYSTDSHAVKTMIEVGDVVVEIDPTSIAVDSNLTTHAERVLANIQAVIEGRATKDQESYSIAGRTLGRTPIADLLKLQDVYSLKVKNQNKKLPRAVLTNFGTR